MVKRQDASTGKIVDDGKPAAAKSKGIPREMEVKVYSPFQTYFDGPAMSISGANDTGAFDILPGHRNFLTLLGKCKLVVGTAQGKRSIEIARGMMHVKADRVIVFLDI